MLRLGSSLSTLSLSSAPGQHQYHPGFALRFETCCFSAATARNMHRDMLMICYIWSLLSNSMMRTLSSRLGTLYSRRGQLLFFFLSLYVPPVYRRTWYPLYRASTSNSLKVLLSNINCQQEGLAAILFPESALMFLCK